MAGLLLRTIDPTWMFRHGIAQDSTKCGSTAPSSFIHHSHYVQSTFIKEYRNCKNEKGRCRLLLCSHNFLQQLGRTRIVFIWKTKGTVELVSIAVVN